MSDETNAAAERLRRTKRESLVSVYGWDDFDGKWQDDRTRVVHAYLAEREEQALSAPSDIPTVKVVGFDRLPTGPIIHLRLQIDDLRRELEQVRAERDEYSFEATRQRYRKQIESDLASRGLPTSGWWDKWRKNPPPKFDYELCELAIIDALTQEGGVAWHGDASSCVTQIVEAYAKQLAEARRALADSKSLWPIHRPEIGPEPEWITSIKARVEAVLAPQESP